MAEIDTENMSEGEAQDFQEIIRQFQEAKANLHTFLTNIVNAEDTTKTGNLDETELGVSALPLRSYKELATISSELLNRKVWSDFFNQMGEIQTASSLSKNGFLARLAVTTNKNQTMADTTPQKKNSGWFHKKEKNDGMIQ